MDFLFYAVFAQFAKSKVRSQRSHHPHPSTDIILIEKVCAEDLFENEVERGTLDRNLEEWPILLQWKSKCSPIKASRFKTNFWILTGGF